MATILLHNADVGTTLILTVEEDGAALDISSATVATLKFYLQDPTGVVTTVTAVFSPTGSGTGTDGKLEYVTVSGDIDTEGRWSLQAGFTLGSWIGRTRPVEFDVGPKY